MKIQGPDRYSIVYCGSLSCRDMSADNAAENSVESVELTAVDESAVCLINDDDAFGTFEIEHDLLLESTDSTSVAPTGVLSAYVVVLSLQ